MDTAIKLAAAVALPFITFWLGRLHQRRTSDEAAVSRWRLIVVWGLAIGLASTAVTAGIIEDRRLRSERVAERAERTEETRRRAIFVSKLTAHVAPAEALARSIPKACPKGVNADLWNAKVEAWRTAVAADLRERALDEAFARDKGDYPHTCKIEWVRNRLEYFAETLTAIIAATR